MKKINYILSFILIVFCLLFFLMDSYAFFPINSWLSCLFSKFSYSGDSLFSTMFSLNISLAFTIVGIAFAIVSLIISKSEITFTAYINYVSRIDPVRANTIIVFFSIVISLLTTYFRFTYIVEIWLKLSLIYPIAFVFMVTKNVTRIESNEIINDKLLNLMMGKKDYIGFFNEVYKPVNKANLLNNLSELFYEFSNSTLDKNLVFECYSEINNQLKGNEV